ncbi:MAG: ATP-dependent RecD-like DNA helicase [Christensenellales bacterium]
MTFRGSVSEIIYTNAENGYSVIIVDGTDGTMVTAVGIFPPVSVGENVELTGEMTEDRRFGEQFSVSNVKITKPSSTEAIYKYLSSGLFVGVGEVTAKAIVSEFKERTLDVIENNPLQLADVKGVSLKKAIAINEKYVSLKNMQDVILYLQSYDVSLNLAIKIYKAYQDATKNIITANPYQMVEDIDGVGFVTADKIAMKIGFLKDSRFRIIAGINYLLKTQTDKNGHTYYPRKKLVEEVAELLGIEDEQLIDDKVGDCEIMGKVAIFDSQEGEGVMLTRNFLTETSIAFKLVQLMKSNLTPVGDTQRLIERYQQANRIIFHPDQINAIKNCLNEGVNIITGGPGTGKTTIVKCIVEIVRSQYLKVELCAPTGRASKRLSQAAGQEAKTIHRLLDLDFKDGKGFFTYNERTRLDADVVIVDEVSMCDEYVFNALIKAIKPGGRLILVGDKDQLPSVGAGNVLSDLIRSGKIPVNYLNYIYRQDEDSKIVSNAHLINQGKMPVIDNRSKDFFVDNQSSPQTILDNAVSMVTDRLPKFAGVKSLDIQVLCPMKKGIAGVENFNKQLQNALNPLSDPKEQIVVGSTCYRVGDKVIHTVNDYKLEWVNVLDNSAGTGVFNGEIGVVENVSPNEPSLTVIFDDGKKVKYCAGDFDQLSLAYAISVHKSQGSEFDVAVIAISGGHYKINTRNLLYTALTRAKKLAVIVGSNQAIAKMVANNYTAKRYTRLVEFIEQAENKKQGELPLG